MGIMEPGKQQGKQHRNQVESELNARKNINLKLRYDNKIVNLDDWESVKNGNLGFNAEQAERELSGIASNYDLILTHFEDGDYGHIHHKFVNQSANKTVVPKVYFASTFNYNTQYQATEPINTELWPLHKEVIEGFQNRNTGLYIVTPEAKHIL